MNFIEYLEKAGTKRFLESLPVWQRVEEVRRDLALISYETDYFVERQANRSKQFEILSYALERESQIEQKLDEKPTKDIDQLNDIIFIDATNNQINEKPDLKPKQKKRRSTARKSTNGKTTIPKLRVKIDSDIVDEDLNSPQEIDLEEFEESKTHKCTPECLINNNFKTEAHVTNIVDEFRDVSDLKVPLLLGWKRKLRKVPMKNRYIPSIVYESPCGKLFPKAYYIRRYLYQTESKMDIDYFTFDRDLVLNRDVGEYFEAYYYLENLARDQTTGASLENKNIRVINQFRPEGLAEDFTYKPDRTPHSMLEKKGFTFNEEFKSSCNCEDDCFQRIGCACHRLNEDFYGADAYHRGTVEYKCSYVNKRLSSQVGTGIFECNSKCPCSSKCSNRVVQNGIRVRLQVQQTLRKGWGVYTLDDIPEGGFICTYSAELLDDADQYGESDMYYADLDFITANQQAKELFSDDDEGVGSGDDDVRIIRLETNVVTKPDNSSQSTLDEIKEDDRGSRYPKRTFQQDQPNKRMPCANTKKTNVRVKDGKFKDIHHLLGSHDYTLDSRRAGNVGRFFNHSCEPNAFVQNVFIETHDLRFPIVAFFASRTIKALEEITWNYNYKVGSIPGREIQCFCGAAKCVGRIL